MNNPFLAFLTRNNLSRLQKISGPAVKLTATLNTLSDEELKARFSSLKQSEKSELPLALAIVREAARRTMGMEPYEVQLQGAAALFQGVVVEMKTGEGKTLTVGLAAAIAAASKQGVHVATVNPYLAQRDAETLEPLFSFLGLLVGVTLPGQTNDEKRAAYACDITYGVHSELGFDYLRDHLIGRNEDKVQRGLAFAIVDEADSILIDEARTPLVISQPASSEMSLYQVADEIIRALNAGSDYEIDEKERTTLLTEAGLSKVEELLVSRGLLATQGALYDSANLHLLRYLGAAMKAYGLFRRDRDYIVRNGTVQIIDDATGRILEGRQWQDGLHQAIECKERVEVKAETETAAEITYQSLFRLYGRLSGLTGTAQTSSEEFEDMYGLIVVPISTHRPVKRIDHEDQIFRSKSEKFAAIVDDVSSRVAAGQPILIGTASVRESEELSARLTQAGIKHNVLNARQNEQEASIIADAGLPGNVTVATNMAGRGTDIVLGGHTEKDAAWLKRHSAVIEAGGLHVLGTTRNESRRVDDQLRGRAGRQGDPGSSQFYLCVDDDLLRVFGGDRINKLFDFLSVSEGALTGPMLNKAVQSAQNRVEGMHFESRKNLAKFDKVMAEQREAVYGLRRDILDGLVMPEYLDELVGESAHYLVDAYVNEDALPEQWDVKGLKAALDEELGVVLPIIKWAMVDDLSYIQLLTKVKEACVQFYRDSREQTSELVEREQLTLIVTLDRLWRAHLTHLASLREGIHLRSYAQVDPVNAFRKDAFDSFVSFRKNFVISAATALLDPLRVIKPQAAPRRVIDVPADTVEPSVNPAIYAKVTRNEMCPCGSGMRYKHCHGKLS